MDTEGVARTMQRSAILDHVFNQYGDTLRPFLLLLSLTTFSATHHRGQISTALTQLGVGAPRLAASAFSSSLCRSPRDGSPVLHPRREATGHDLLRSHRRLNLTLRARHFGREH